MSSTPESIEKVLVVKADWVHNQFEIRGFIPDIPEDFISELPRQAFFMDRPDAELDPSFRQIIPYVLISHEGTFLTVTRLKTQGEKRLHDKMSIGIGGHINPIDKDESDILDGGLRRELCEELNVDNPPGFAELPLLGLILSDGNEVSRVHMGLVMKWEVESPVTIREIDKMKGEYRKPSEIKAIYDRLENWSALVYDGIVDSVANANSAI